MACKHFALSSLALLIAAIGLPGAARAQNATEEVVRQTSRQVSDAISRRIGETTADTVAVSAQDKRPEAEKPQNSIWFQQSYDRITPDDDGSFDYSVEVHQTLLGGDEKLGRFMFGGAAGFARAVVSTNIGDKIRSSFQSAGLSSAAGSAQADSTTSSFGNDSNTFSVTPYGAYIIDERFFLLGLGGYQRTQPDNSLPGSDTLLFDVSGNAHASFDGFFVEGRAGLRYSHTWIASANQSSSNSSYTPYVDFKGGYDFGRVKPFGTVGFEHSFSSGGAFSSGATTTAGLPTGTPQLSSETDDNRLFLGAGLQFEAWRDIVFELAMKAEVLNSDTDQIGAYGRVQFRF